MKTFVDGMTVACKCRQIRQPRIFLLPYKKSCTFFILPIKLNDTLKSDLSSLG